MTRIIARVWPTGTRPRAQNTDRPRGPAPIPGKTSEVIHPTQGDNRRRPATVRENRRWDRVERPRAPGPRRPVMTAAPPGDQEAAMPFREWIGAARRLKWQVTAAVRAVRACPVFNQAGHGSRAQVSTGEQAAADAVKLSQQL